MEELKLIMQTLAGLGETAKEGFIWWLAIDKLVPTLLWAAFGGSIVGVIAYTVSRISLSNEADRELAREQSESIAAIKVIRGILGVYAYPGLKQDSRHYAADDFKVTIEAVRPVKDVASRRGE